MLVRQSRTIFLALAATCLFISACDDDDDDGTAPVNQSTVRFVNAMTGGTGSLSLSAGSSAPGNGVAYQAAGACQTLAPASTGFTITPTGSSTTLVTVPPQDLTARTKYTLLATGSVTTPTAIFLTDTYTTPPVGRARLRVINAVGAASPFDVYVSAPGVPLGTANQSNVIFNSTQTSYLDVPAGETQVRVTLPGDQTLLGTSATFTLNSGDVRTLVFTPSTTVGGTFTSFLVPQCL